MKQAMTRIKRTALLLLAATAFTFLGGCYASPTPSDVERVKEQFLILRFRLALSPEKARLGDRQLFEMSCRNNRVRCGEVLRILQREDGDFYKVLMKEWKRDESGNSWEGLLSGREP